MRNLYAMMDKDGDGWVGAEDLYRLIKEVEPGWT